MEKPLVFSVKVTQDKIKDRQRIQADDISTYREWEHSGDDTQTVVVTKNGHQIICKAAPSDFDEHMNIVEI